VSALEAGPGIRPHALVVVRRGAVVLETAWAPYAVDRPQLLYSLSKSFTSTAVGLARAEGLVDLDATVLSYFPELDADVTDARSRAMRVRDIAAMASGHAAETIDRAATLDPADLVRGFLRIPPDADPGTLFAYNQPCTYTLAAIVQRAAGESLVDYLRPRLFEPLGISDVAWIEQPAGRNVGFSGLHADVRAVARLGELYRRGGLWGEQRILDAEWVAEATRRHVATPPGNPDWAQGYGFQFWMGQHGYRGDGAFGQYCVVLPEHELVVALTSETPEMQSVLDALWEHVLPALERPGTPVDDAALAEQVEALTLPHPATGPLPGGAPELLPVDSRGPRRAALDAVQVTPQADGAWVLELVDAHGSLPVRVVPGTWTANEPTGIPIVASGGTTDAGDVVADLLFVDTPHTLRVRRRPGSPTIEAAWLTEPLHGSSPRAQCRP